MIIYNVSYKTSITLTAYNCMQSSQLPTAMPAKASRASSEAPASRPRAPIINIIIAITIYSNCCFIDVQIIVIINLLLLSLLLVINSSAARSARRCPDDALDPRARRPQVHAQLLSGTSSYLYF